MPKETKEQTLKNTTEKNNISTKKMSKNVVTNLKNKATLKSTTAKRRTTTSKKTTVQKVTNTKKPTSKSRPTTKRSTTKKVEEASKKSVVKKVAVPIVEYYDLPYRYNQTIIKLLAQTPTTLFVYWDISDEDREKYKKTYGEHFFEETKPVLIIHNNTLNYSFEVEINDFANSWYLHVNDSKCNYTIELGRRPISKEVKINTDYIYVSSSNVIESPNNKILFNTVENKVYFRNVKTNVTSTRSISFIKNMGKIYNIYDFYKTTYKNETLKDFPSSIFK